MDEVTKGRLRGELSDKQYAERIESIKRFERQLTDNGYLVLKLFFQIGKKEQKKRLEELEGNKDTAWRVGENDWWQNKHYDKCEEVFDKYLTDTNASVAPWYIIDSGTKSGRSYRCWRRCAAVSMWLYRTKAWQCLFYRTYSLW